jgi:RNA polymerase sigma-70 factor (ECF subfamily)
MDKTDFERLCREHWQAMWAYALRRTDPAADAADVVSEIFLVAWRRRGEIPPGDAERLWLYGVARHTVMNVRRGTVRRSRLHARLAEVASLNDLVGPDPMNWGRPGPAKRP